MHIHADCSAAGQSVDTLTPLLPLVMDDQRLGIRRQPPSLGGDTDDILSSLGYSTAQTDALKKQGVIR